MTIFVRCLTQKQNMIESKIIDHITYLNEVQHLSYVSIQTYLSGILRFFSMNDYHINTKKIRRFLPEDIVSEDAPRDSDRPYSAAEIQQILSRCDIRARVCSVDYDLNWLPNRCSKRIVLWRYHKNIRMWTL